MIKLYPSPLLRKMALGLAACIGSAAIVPAESCPEAHALAGTLDFDFNLAVAPAKSVQVFLVGPKLGPGVDFLQISDAIEAANNGDIIRVLPSPGADYLPFIIDGKGLSLLSAAPKVRIGIRTLEVRNLSLGQRVRIRGFIKDELLEPTVLANNAGAVYLNDLRLSTLRITDSSGGTWIQDCDLGLGSGSTRGVHTIEVTDSNRLTLQSCELRAGMAAQCISSLGSTLYVYDTVVLPPMTDTQVGPGSPSVVLDRASFFYTENSSIVGGDAHGDLSQCLQDGAAALVLDGGSLYVGRGTVLLGGLSQDLCTGTSARVTRFKFLGSGKLFDLSGTGRSMHAPSAVKVGEALTFDLTGRPGEPVSLLYSTSTANTYLPQLLSTLFLPARTIKTLATVVLDASGKGSYTLQAGLPSGGNIGEFYVQALFSPSFGPSNLGGPTLSSPARILVLDSEVPTQ